MTSMTVYSWLIYAMFMFHPENNTAWRVTEALRFNSFAECEKFYRENTDKLIGGLRDHMVANIGPVDKGEYTLLEVGCTFHDGANPVVTQRIPLSTHPVIESFLVDPKEINI